MQCSLLTRAWRHRTPCGTRSIVYTCAFNDPYKNLAIEDWLFRTGVGSSTTDLLIWRNRPCVVIGRNQLPSLEANLTYLSSQKIPLIRRLSGGGTVYHDEGNVNYTLFMPRNDFDRRKGAELTASALNALAVPASVSDRNDILLEGKKISGSAYKIAKDRAYHHGTMLLNANLAHLRAALKTNKPHLKSKGVASVPSPVCNVAQVAPHITYASFLDALTKRYQSTLGRTSPEVVHIDDMYLYKMNAQHDIANTISQLTSWEWTFGQSPDAHLQFETDWFGSDATLDLETHRGIIKSCQIKHADPTWQTFFDQLARSFVGERYEAALFEKVFASVVVEDIPTSQALFTFLRKVLEQH